MPVSSPRDWNLETTWLDELNGKYGTQIVAPHPLPRIFVRHDAARAVHLASWVPYTVDCWVQALGLTTAHNVVVAGCGFGWQVEELNLRGIKAVGLEISTWIWGLHNQTETTAIRGYITAAGLNPDSGDGAAILAALDDGGIRTRAVAPGDPPNLGILNETASNNLSRNRIKTALTGSINGTVHFVITDDVLSVLDDVTGNAYRNNLSSLGGQVVHYVSVNEPTINWINSRTIAEWKAALPSDLFIKAGTRVLA